MSATWPVMYDIMYHTLTYNCRCFSPKAYSSHLHTAVYLLASLYGYCKSIFCCVNMNMSLPLYT